MAKVTDISCNNPMHSLYTPWMNLFPAPFSCCSSGWFPVQYVDKIWPTPEP